MSDIIGAGLVRSDLGAGRPASTFQLFLGQRVNTPARATAAGAATPHAAEEALAALLDAGDGDPSGRAGDVATTRRHVASCPVCTRHLAELRALRDALQQAATREAAPLRDLARAALERLRLRQGTVGRLNELLSVLVGFVRDLATLLTDPKALGEAAGPPGPSERPDVSGAAGAVGGARG